MWGYRKSKEWKEKKMKSKKFRVIGNSNCHGYEIGEIIKMHGSYRDGIIGPRKPYFGYLVRYSDMEEITENQSFFYRLYTAIIGALFGHESHSRNRY